MTTPSPAPVSEEGGRPDAAVELLVGLDGAAETPVTRRQPSSLGRRLRRGLLGLGLAYLVVALAFAAFGDDDTLARIQPVEVRLGDPFAVGVWQELPTVVGAADDRPRPPPMVNQGLGRSGAGGSEHPICAGFGRLDWPAEERAPSVAYCMAADTVELFDPGELVVVRAAPAGGTTWLFLLVPYAAGPLDVDLRDGEPDDIEQVHVGSPWAAIRVVDERLDDLTLRWTIEISDGGGAETYRCRLGRDGVGEWRCG
ncbi:MAG: hypothetical protein AAGD35_22645 [Actinomycetota bacterium]